MNSEELLLAMNDMEQELILDAQRLRPRPVKAWIAGALTAAAALALVFLAPWRVPADPMIVPTGGEPTVTDPSNYEMGEPDQTASLFDRFPDTAYSTEPVLPPVRVGEMVGSTRFARGYTLEEAYHEADAVAVIRIGNWLGEEVYGVAKTLYVSYYKAEVLSVYRGVLDDSILFSQAGGSRYTWHGYPLHTYGDTFLVFLKEAEDGHYFSLLWHATELEQFVDSEGRIYYIDKFGALGSTTDLEPSGMQKRHEIAKALEDESLAKPGSTLYCFSQDALEALFEGYEKGK